MDAGNLTRLLEEYQLVGFGGVEITCIYGVQGNDSRNLPYRSDAWVKAVRHTIDEANRLGLGVDLPAGSGWRMGGPNIPPQLANSRLVLDSKEVTGPVDVDLAIGRATPLAASATSPSGEAVDLTPFIKNGRLTWQAPADAWRIDTAAYRWSGDKVKRPAPGGAGLNINPFWRRSVDAYLEDFSGTLSQLPGLRAQFHDSFEYNGDWSPVFFDEFRERRGYRLEEHLAELAGNGESDKVARTKADYRETLSDLVLDDFIGSWVEWSHNHGLLARNQSHGSPANWLDLYAACDIPEIESFGRLNHGDANPLVLKFASSAANVAGKQLVSSETATWLDEHFHVTLGQIKQMVDRQVLAGVNHVVYHGTAYSPDDAKWPGWLFYASTQLNPQNPIWRDLPELNAYVTRLQSVLQESRPDNDVLLYWPISDYRHNERGLRQNLSVHNSNAWFTRQPIGRAASTMQTSGRTFDYVSDRLLLNCRAGDDGRVQAPGGEYAAIVLPQAEHIPLATLQHLAELAEAGCKVLVWGDGPTSLPGLKGAEDEPRWAAQRESFDEALKRLLSKSMAGEELPALLDAAGIQSESWTHDSSLAFLRKRNEDGVFYFICNQGESAFDGWISPQGGSVCNLLMDPASGRLGLASVEMTTEGRRRVRLQLARGETVLLSTPPKSQAESSNLPLELRPWNYHAPSGKPTPLRGWSVEYIAGGPALPKPFESDTPHAWTESADPAAESFAGTARYACRFDAPGDAGRWRLDLGEVLDSATVRLNGEVVATLVGPRFAIDLESVRSTANLLEIDVTGVAANRIRDLDRRGVKWRIFEDINLVNINYKGFDASEWPVRPLGLKGPITLTPLAPPK